MADGYAGVSWIFGPLLRVRYHGSMASTLSLAEYALFLNKEELVPLWLRLRPRIESLGDDVVLEIRERYAEFARVGAEFALAEPTAGHLIELGLHNPGLPFDDRFRDATGWGPRRITHRTMVSEEAGIDADLDARLHVAYALAREGEPR